MIMPPQNKHYVYNIIKIYKTENANIDIKPETQTLYLKIEKTKLHYEMKMNCI